MSNEKGDRLRTLNRYILREFFGLMGPVFASLVGIYLIAEFFERIDDFIEHNASVGDALLYFLYKLPLVVYQITPIAVLFPTILLISRFNRTGEMTAIKTGGVSLFRTAAPILMVSLLVSGFVFLLGEFVVSPSLHRLDYVYEVKIKEQNSSEYQQKNIWVKTDRNQIWSISRFMPRKMKMEDVVVFTFDGNNSLRMRVDAGNVLKEDRRWRFRNAFVRTFSGGRITSTQVFDDVTLPLNINLADLKTDFSRPERTSFRELKKKVRKRRSVGLQSNAIATDMHSKLSYPLASLVMVLLGIPFTLGRERGGKLAWGIVLGITISALYWILFFVGASLGHSGLLPPLPAAWGANILLSLAGVYMMLGA